MVGSRLFELSYFKKICGCTKKKDIHFVYSVEVFNKDEEVRKQDHPIDKISYKGEPVIIIGSGPAGLFAALRLVERGVPCLLLEQGSEAPKRMKSINRFWRYGELDKKNNVCFGEGGAGLYSDGKLITRIKSPHIPYVLHRLVKFGAPDEIQYLSNPHVGSDRLRRIIPPLRNHLIDNGCKVQFDTEVTEILTHKNNQILGVKTHTGEIIHSPHVILACGHSAEDMFSHLNEIGVFMEGKSFAVGLRIEHPQSIIDKIQYSEAYNHPKLGAANYKLAHHDKETHIGVYSFCMCPGGYVLSSGTQADGVVSNGMSNFNRNSPFANSAVVVSIDFKKNFSKNDFFAGIKFRRDMENKAYKSVLENGGTKELPGQKLTDFFEGRLSSLLKHSCPSGAVPVRLDRVLPGHLTESIKVGIDKFSQSMKGFKSEKAQLFGVESRTSCPLRITRDPQTLESISHKGLYPTGEGAGYAGGITSAACDGVNVAEAIVAKVQSSTQSASQKELFTTE